MLLRGLGLNFFDYMALLTTGHGGTFVRSGSLLVYRPSGNEPRLYAGSRRGIPYHARGGCLYVVRQGTPVWFGMVRCCWGYAASSMSFGVRDS